MLAYRQYIYIFTKQFTGTIKCSLDTVHSYWKSSFIINKTLVGTLTQSNTFIMAHCKNKKVLKHSFGYSRLHT